MEAIETKTVGRYTVAVHYDEDGWACDPRDWDHGTIMVLSHNRRDLPNDAGLDFDQFDGWAGVLEELRERYDIAGILPVYCYEHSGIALSTGRGYPFDDPWDAGQLGFILMDSAGQEMCGTPDDRVEELLAGAVAEYGAWLNGEVYGYTVTRDDGEVVDSCWGFVGEDDYAMAQGVDAAEWATFRDACAWAGLPEWVRQSVLLDA